MLQQKAQRELERARVEGAARVVNGTARDRLDRSTVRQLSTAREGLLDATSAAEDALKLARVLVPELEQEPEPELLMQTVDQ
eukprot:COSAG02_NODE_26285_length_636_cov_0.953445_1_plen_81_part_01